MNRKYLPLVVCLLVTLLASCGLAPTTIAPAQETETEIARFSTAAAAFDATVTAVFASVPTSSETPAATDTLTPTPTNTPQPPTPTATQTGTPTEEPPLAPIADVCKLPDLKLAGTLLGDNIVKTQKFAEPGGYYGCSMSAANGTTGVILSVAQAYTGTNKLVTAYAEIDPVQGCAMPVPVAAAAVKTAHDAFDNLGFSGSKLVLEAYSREFKLIKDKGCTDQYGVQAIPGLGDAAYADHIYGYEELGTVFRNTLFYIVAYKTGITAAQAVDIDQKLLAPVIKQLSSDTAPGPTDTTTEGPPLAPIADVCKLLDIKLAGDLLGEPMVKTQNLSQKDSWDRCYTGNANASTGVTLAVAQDKTAVGLQLIAYAEIDPVQGCGMPVPVGAAAVKTASDELDKLGLTGNKLVRESYSWEFMLIKDKSCTDPYGVQVVPGLGDVAYADHIWGHEEMGTVYRNTLIYINAYKKGITAAQAVDIDQKLLEAAIKQLSLDTAPGPTDTPPGPTNTPSR
jgi:hypothetical protein